MTQNDDHRKKCFVLSPIGTTGSSERLAADKVLRHIVRAALPDFQVLRADDDNNPGAITPQIVSRILEADLIVADLSGHNPNVMYELAIAHGYQKPTVHIEQSSEKAPFDVKDMRIVFYDVTDLDSVDSAKKKLADYAAFAVKTPERVETPLSNAKEFVAVQASADPIAQSNLQVMDAIKELGTLVRRALPATGSARSAARERSLERELRRAEVELAELRRIQADVQSAKQIVDKIVADDRGDSSDFEDVITFRTSEAFDDWVRSALKSVTGQLDKRALDEVLMDATVFEMIYLDEEGDPDEDGEDDEGEDSPDPNPRDRPRGHAQ